ncbi:trimethyltridecatetraene synthase [Medicago truncatula]|uniref:Cytochrome P450 family protein n=2 Tax=Medicago truncatula TaxID=3880 RepID=G7L7J7_MEDTR|nr:trimethyltridecatetraene synthase [Medicago truncatula]AET01783.1 cytochrome P450 family protein [Medicago truncatula]
MIVELFVLPNWVTFCTTFVILLLFIHRLRLHRRKYNLPPGPKPWPIIGNMNLIGSLPHQSIHGLTKKYGPIMRLWFGSKLVIVGSSPDIAKAFLKTNDIVLVGRPKFACGKYTTYNYSNITWNPYGPYFQQARKMFQRELFSVKSLESYEYMRKEELHIFLHKLFNSKNKTILLKDHLSTFSLNIISRMVLGKKYLEKSENVIISPEEFKEMLDELFLLNGVFNIGDFIPWIQFLDLQGYVKRMKACGKRFNRFMEHVLEEHIERRKDVKDYVAKDMVDVLLQLAENPNLEVKIKRNGVKAFTQDLIAGGTDTSSVIIEWAISELVKRPEIIKRATEELDRVIGRDRWVEEKDIVNLPYVFAIAKETMRLHPVTPMLVPREATENCNVDGYDIPKGTMILVNTWTIGRDSDSWDNPYEFIPERFINNDIDIIKGHDYKMLPLGAGRRMCPGYPLGLKVVQSSLANLLHGFNWRLPNDMKKEDLNMEEIFGLTTPKKIPLEVVLEPKLPYHLYCL